MRRVKKWECAISQIFILWSMRMSLIWWMSEFNNFFPRLQFFITTSIFGGGKNICFKYLEIDSKIRRKNNPGSVEFELLYFFSSSSVNQVLEFSEDPCLFCSLIFVGKKWNINFLNRSQLSGVLTPSFFIFFIHSKRERKGEFSSFSLFETEDVCSGKKPERKGLPLI